MLIFGKCGLDRLTKRDEQRPVAFVRYKPRRRALFPFTVARKFFITELASDALTLIKSRARPLWRKEKVNILRAISLKERIAGRTQKSPRDYGLVFQVKARSETPPTLRMCRVTVSGVGAIGVKASTPRR